MPGTLLAFHFDMKRAMWAEDFMAGYAATLAEWGYNTILYEVEDKLIFPNHPALAHVDALDATATGDRMASLRGHGFRIIPMVQSLGHAEAVLTKPGYERFRESPAHDSQYDPLSEDARGLICDLIDQVIDAVRPEDYFHLGGDETWNLGQSPKCQPIVAEIGTGGLYLRHMLPIIEHVIARGLRPILWADIALSHPEIIDRFPREVAWMDWDYWTAGERWDSLHVWETARRFTWPELASADAPGFSRYLAPYAVDEQTRRDGTFPAFPYTAALRGMGFDVITAPATRSWGDAMGIPLNSVHLPNCFFATLTGRNAGNGACVTSWTVRHSHPLVNLPGAYVATQGFSGEEAFDADALLCRYAEERFDTALPAFADAVRLAEGRVPWCQMLEMTPPASACDAIRNWLDEVDAQPEGRAGLMASIEQTAFGSGGEALP